MLMVGTNEYVELKAEEVLALIAARDLLVIEQCVGGEFVDRWLSHRLEPLSLTHIAAGEELRIRSATA
ncbi:MAG: hypothetical protein GY946_18935 [bacterium]|nr:hypothetical protein [bacterium]